MDWLIYLLKVNVAIALLYGLYWLLSRKDTFFGWKRVVLLGILFVAASYPALNLSEHVMQNKQLRQMAETSAFIQSYFVEELRVEATETPAVTVTETMPEAVPIIVPTPERPRITGPLLLLFIYLLGVLLLSLRMLVQLIQLSLYLRRSRKEQLFGHTVRVCDGVTTPFSFFGWVVLDPSKHSDNELREILLHEQTHVSQRHTIDMLLTELACIACWFNPIIWLMRREIRINLEYLADHSVLEAGCEAMHYQFHLLRLTYHTTAVQLSNNFNVSPLKKRIKMMNTKQSKRLGLTKYALFVPIVAMLLVMNNLRAVGIELPETEVEERLIALPAVNDRPEEDERIFSRVEIPPHYPGGEEALMQWINENLQYPASAKEKKEEGRVVVEFVVDKEGKVQSPIVKRSVSAALDSAALDLVRKMPDWKPGSQNGKKVSVYYHLPVTFQLSKSEQETKTGSVETETEAVKWPRFPGGDEAMFKFVQEKLRSPLAAPYKGALQGIYMTSDGAINGFVESSVHYEKATSENEKAVIVQFGVEADGSVSDIRIVEGLDKELNDEARRVIRSMPKWNMPPNDSPRHHKVRLPVTFTSTPRREIEYPVFPGGEEAMFKFIQGNLRSAKAAPYKIAEKKELITLTDGPNGLDSVTKAYLKYDTSTPEGEKNVMVKFNVGADGTVSNVTIAEGINTELNNEALRVIRSMPKWETPKDYPSRIVYTVTVPVTFTN